MTARWLRERGSLKPPLPKPRGPVLIDRECLRISLCLSDGPMVSRQDIMKGLRELGLRTGEVVVAHSSLSSFGRVDGGAEAVVDALIDALGPSGTLVVPTFSYSSTVFDRSDSPSDVGAISEAVRARRGAVRSRHPTHSVAAIGPLAADIVEGHENVAAFGRGSPLFKVLQARGKVLLLGVDHTANSMIHLAEEIAGVGYLDRSRRASFKLPSGRIVSKWVRRPGCSMGFDKLEESLREKGGVSDILIGDCRARLMSARTVVNAALEALKSDPEALLCERPECGTCAEARAMLAALQVEEQAKEVTELAEQDERALRLIERRLGGSVSQFEPECYEQSPN